MIQTQGFRIRRIGVWAQEGGDDKLSFVLLGLFDDDGAWKYITNT